MPENTKILLKRSMVDGKVPIPSAMTEGELYVNISSAMTADNFLSTVRAGKKEVIQFMDKKYNEKMFAPKTELEDVKGDIEELIREIEDNELVIAQAYNQHNISAGFDENGMSALDGGISLTEAIIELQNEWGHQGPVGPVGPTGPQGATGPQGTKGADGPKGAQGWQGPQGATGPQGTKGTDGAKGAQGRQGPQGATGPQGTKGTDGAKGAQGWQGPQGAKGETGDRGHQGWQGPQGAKGPQGTVGTTGPQGTIGTHGTKGDRGYQGWQGPQGATGPQGTKGADGAKGAQGWQGPQGAKGADSTVQGPRGYQGWQGPQGAKGANSTVAGPVGAQGRQGPQGAKGADSTVQGPRGYQGWQGPKGAAGSDATVAYADANGRNGVIRGADYMEVGRAFDFHYTTNNMDYTVRLQCPNLSTGVKVTLPSVGGTLATTDFAPIKLKSSNGTSKYYLVGVNSSTAGGEASAWKDTNVYMSGSSLYCSSDETLKTFIDNVDGAPEKIKQIPKVYFHWNNDEKKEKILGTFAQGVQKVYPEIVTQNEDTGKLAVSYDKLGVIALAGIDKLYEMIQELQRENKELRKRIEDLEK